MHVFVITSSVSHMTQGAIILSNTETKVKDLLWIFFHSTLYNKISLVNIR